MWWTKGKISFLSLCGTDKCCINNCVSKDIGMLEQRERNVNCVFILTLIKNALVVVITWMIFLFFSAKTLIVSIWSKTWERAPGWLKSCLVAAETGFRQKP